jgi:beta-lactamase regulating signal transducer with metallopeptidase domain
MRSSGIVRTTKSCSSFLVCLSIFFLPSPAFASQSQISKVRSEKEHCKLKTAFETAISLIWCMYVCVYLFLSLHITNRLACRKTQKPKSEGQ